MNLGVSVEAVRAEVMKLLRRPGPVAREDDAEVTAQAAQADAESLRASTNPASLAALEGRLTPNAQKVMKLANQEAHQSDDGRGHGACVARIVPNAQHNRRKGLNESRRRFSAASARARKAPPAGTGPRVQGELSKTPQTKKAIEYAMEEAYNLHHGYVGTEHLLWASRARDRAVVQVLRDLGLTLERTREGSLDDARSGPRGGIA